ncbi:MAG: ATP-binding protein [Actinomycetota bacterium]
MNAWRHSRCSVIRVDLSFDPDEVRLRVLDDGVGVSRRHEQRDSWVGLRGMKRVLGEVGGSLRVANMRPRGVVVQASVPRRSC